MPLKCNGFRLRQQGLNRFNCGNYEKDMDARASLTRASSAIREDARLDLYSIQFCRIGINVRNNRLNLCLFMNFFASHVSFRRNILTGRTIFYRLWLKSRTLRLYLRQPIVGFNGWLSFLSRTTFFGVCLCSFTKYLREGVRFLVQRRTTTSLCFVLRRLQFSCFYICI